MQTPVEPARLEPFPALPGGPRAQGDKVPPWLQGLPLEDGPDAPGVGLDGPRLRTSLSWAGSRIYGLELHVHGVISEGTATPQWALDEAQAQGIDVMWWTDHDSMYHPDPLFQVTGDDFESGGIVYDFDTWPTGDTLSVSWRTDSSNAGDSSFEVSTEAAYTGDYGGRLSVSGTGSDASQHLGVYLKVAPRLNFAPVMAQADLSFTWRPTDTTGDAEFRLVVPLSATSVSEDVERLDSDDYRVVYYWNNTGTEYTTLEDGVSIFVPLDDPGDGWGIENQDITSTVYAALGEEAWGLHAELVTLQGLVTRDSSATFDIDDISWSTELTGSELMDEQRDYLDTLSTALVQHIGTEISVVSGRHFNSFGRRVPFLDYGSTDELTGTEVADWIHANNGMMSWNHIFGVQLGVADDDTRVDLVDAAIDELVEHDGYGADLLEVGYRSRQGQVQDFLTVWDAAADNDIILTGIGTNDLHDRTDWDGWVNRYITWVPSVNAGEARLTLALVSGQAWFGDPTLFPDGKCVLQLGVPTLGMDMGQGAVGLTGTYNAIFTADWLDEGWELRAVENGAVVETWTVDGAGEFRVGHSFDPEGGLTLRFEVWDADGDGVAFTNPLYFRDTDDGAIPSWRLVD